LKTKVGWCELCERALY